MMPYGYVASHDHVPTIERALFVLIWLHLINLILRKAEKH